MKITKETVYALLRTIPKGKVTTYKALAQVFGSKGYRAVGQILKQNPDAPRTPCHRVVASNGTIGGFMGKRDGAFIRRKRKLLESEGIRFSGSKVVGFDNVLYDSFKMPG